jgi:hypothetical protein
MMRMAKRDPRGSRSPKSKERRAKKKASGGVNQAQQGQLGQVSGPAETATLRLGAGRRIRTPPPQVIPEQLEEIKVGEPSPLAKLEEKAEQFRNIREFLQNPVPLNLLAGKEIDTSSPPEEIETRKREVRYQIQVMRSMLAVLTDELNELEQARPLLNPDQPSRTHS